MNYKPIADRIIVKPDPIEDKTKSGIILTTDKSSLPKPNKGTVVSTGEGRYSEHVGARIPMTIQIGDRVVYGMHVGLEMELNGKEYLIMREGEVMLIETN
jgi:chaperonin GroES